MKSYLTAMQYNVKYRRYPALSQSISSPSLHPFSCQLAEPLSFLFGDAEERKA